MVKLFIFLCYIVLLVIAIGADDCPQLDVKGNNPFPNLLDIVDGQMVGYHALVEVNIGSNSKLVDDYFNGLTGILNIKEKNSGLNRLINYYPSADGAYIIKNDGNCDSMDLNVANQKKIVGLWSTLDYSMIYNATKSLGPVGLLVYLISQRDDLLLLTNSTNGLDSSSSFNMSTHWYTCLPFGPRVHVHLDSFGKLTQMILLQDGLITTFNYIKLSSIPSDKQRPVTYPYGHGCVRTLEPSKMVPRFAESDSFMLNMQISLFYDEKAFPEKMDSLNILRYKGIYSYENINDPRLRIVFDSKLSIEYLISLDSGTCSIKEAVLQHSGYLKWPFANDSALNILSPLVLELREDDMSYLGQIELDSKLFDIYERQVESFAITYGEYRSALITYFIPIASRSYYRAPSTIEIKFQKFSPQTAPKSVSHIRVEVIDYLESDDLYDPDRFDLRSCYNEPGQSTWFQIVFSDVPTRTLTLSFRQAILEYELRKALDFIPMTRLSDIRLVNYGPSLYITSKLSDGPGIFFAYEAQPNNILTNPSIELIRDSDVDCAKLCTSYYECKAFSYCGDRQCNLLGGSLPVSTQQTDKQCTVYMLKLLRSNDSHDANQLDQFTSSSLLLNNIKSMVNDRQLTLPYIGTADNMFIISGPYEVGGYDDTYEYDDSKTSKLNDYKLILTGYELIETKQNAQLTGLNYLDCLYYCENDDNCLTVSYCDGGNGECTISSKSADTIIAEDKHKNLKTSCKIMSKNFIDYFHYLPGRSLIRDPEALSQGFRRLAIMNRETCAKACLDEHSFTCEAFDFCESKSEQESFVCLLHVFHIFENASDKSYTWDSNATRCDHYTRKLSMDYKQFFGMKFTDGQVIATINENSLENCASACNQAEEGCDSFEYCQPADSRLYISSCRLSSNQVIGDISNLTTASSCSVYGIVRPEHRNQVRVIKRAISFPLYFICGLITFLLGVFISALINRLFIRKIK